MRAAAFLAALTLSAHAQWTLQQSNTTADLRGIDNVGHGIAWASGTNGTVLHTTDNGATWLLCMTPPDAEHLDFRGIQAFDADTAIVMSSGKGDLSRLYKTTDGCQTWKLLFTNPDKDGFWDAVVFFDETSGLLLGDPVGGSFFVARTRDGGKNWTRQRNPGLHAEANAQGAFAASNSSAALLAGGVALGSGGTGGSFFYHEETIEICLDACSQDELNLDGRKNQWSRAPVPVGTATEASGIFSFDFRCDPNQRRTVKAVVAVGGDYTNPEATLRTAAYSTNYGNNWTASATPPHGYRSAVAYDAPTKTWITVGPNGTDISNDDGRNWRALKPGPTDSPDADQHWNALSLPFVVGPHGRIGLLERQVLKPK